MPNPFGQSADYSGVFSSLGREQISQIATAVRSAASQSANDQNAADQDAQSKWKNGQMSDSEWLDYIRKRLAEASGDPEEQQRWADALRVNQSAIEDAQFETKFQLGKITAQALLSHYNQRMQGVEGNSPAYRDLAGRYQQVVDYIKGGGSSGGSGSSGGGGGSRGTASKLAGAAAKGSTPGGSISASGYDQSGEDVVPDSSVFYGTGNVKYYTKTLLADQDRIKAMMDQYKRDPTLQYLVDPLSGTNVPATAELMHSLDNQYLRNQDNLASVYSTTGDPQKYTAALTAKTDYISTYMVDHNTDKIETAYTEFQKGQVALLKSASDLPPDQRPAVYARIAQNTKSFIDGSFPGEAGIGLRQYLGQNPVNKGTQELGVAGQAITADLPPELKASGALHNVLQGWSYLGQIGSDPNLSDVELRQLADEAIRLIPGNIDPTTAVGTRGERTRLSSKDISDLIDGDPLDPNLTLAKNSIAGPSYTGIFASMIQREGLNNTDPSHDGPRFVYQVNPDGSHQVVVADAPPDATGTKLLLQPRGQDRATQIQVGLKINGETVIAYAKPTNIPVNLLPPGMAVYASNGSIQVPDGKGGQKTLAQGTLVSSDFIKTQESAHPGWFQGLVRTGALVKSSPAWGVVIDNPGSSQPVIWFQDAKSGTMSRVPPHLDTSQQDTVTGGALVGADNQPSFNDVPFSGGSVIAFGAGFTNGEMRNTIRDQVGNGSLDLNDFKTRGAGTSIGGSPTIDDVLEPFKSTPAELHQMRGAHGAKGWGKEHDELQAGLEQQRQDKTKAWLEQHNMAGVASSPGAMNAISSMAGFLGIKIAGDDPVSPDKTQAPKMDPSVVARNDALAASKARLTGRPTRFGLTAKVDLTSLPDRHGLTTPNPAPVIGPHPLVLKPIPPTATPKNQTIESGRYKGKNLGGL